MALLREVTDQHDLFVISPSKEELESFTGRIDPKYDEVKYLTSPKWDDKIHGWTCLAVVSGALCVVKVTIRGEVNV